MQVFASPDRQLRELNTESILAEMLKVAVNAVPGGGTVDETYEAALLEVLKIIKDETGINAPRLVDALRTINGDPADGVLNALQAWPKFESKFRSAINRLVALQGDTPWLFNADGQGGIELLDLSQLNGQTPVSLDVQVGRVIQGTGPADLMFSISGEAKAAMNLEICDHKELAEDYGITDLSPASDLFLVYLATGEVGLKADTERAITGGDLSVGAGVSAAAGMRYIFQYEKHMKTVRALTDSASQLINPLDLNAVHQALAIKGARGLREIRFQGARSGWLDLDMNFARMASTPTLVNAPAGQETLPLNQWLNATVSIRYRAEVDRMMSITRGDGEILLTSRHGSSRTSMLGLTLGAGIELVGLGKLAGKWVEHLLPDMAELTDTLKKYAKPGDLLVKKAKAELDGQEDWVQTLGELLLGTATPNAAAQELTKDLNERIADTLDSAVDIFDIADNRVDELSEKLTAAIVRDNTLLTIFREHIEGWIQDEFADALLGFWGDFRDRINKTAADLETRMQATTVEKVEKLLKPLAGFGANTQELVSSLNNGGEKLLGPSIKLLQQYAQQRKKLVDVVEKTAKAKLAIEIEISNTRTESGVGNMVYGLRIPGNNRFSNRTCIAYKRWLLGRLEIGSDFGGVGERKDGSFEYSITGKRTVNITFDLGPRTFDWNGMIESSVNFKVNLDGSIMVGEAGFRGEFSGGKLFGPAGEVSFSGGMPVITETGAVIAEPFLVSYTYRNDRCSMGELDNFLDSTQNIDENGPFGSLTAERQLQLLAAFEARGHRRARVEISAAMSAETISTHAAAGIDVLLMATMLYEAQRDVNRNRISSLVQAVGKADATVPENIVHIKKAMNSSGKSLESFLEHKDALGKSIRHTGFRLGYRLLKNLIHALEGAELFFTEVQAFQVWRRGLLAPALSANARIREREIRTWTKETSRIAYDYTKQAANGLRQVIDTTTGGFINSNHIPPDTLAFLTYFDKKLSGSGVIGALSLESSPRGDRSEWVLVSE